MHWITRKVLNLFFSSKLSFVALFTIMMVSIIIWTSTVVLEYVASLPYPFRFSILIGLCAVFPVALVGFCVVRALMEKPRTTPADQDTD
jgi:hypothetical protein